LYEVAPDFDKTEPQRQCLDQYLLDDSIIQILEHVLPVKPKNDFYDKYPSIAHSIFSKPYPIIARRMLGYPTSDSLSDDDSDIEFLGTTPGDGSYNNDKVLPATQP
jgi:hypothetical protein